MNSNTIERVEYGLDCTDLISDESNDCRESLRPKSRFNKYESGKLNCFDYIYRSLICKKKIAEANYLKTSQKV